MYFTTVKVIRRISLDYVLLPFSYTHVEYMANIREYFDTDFSYALKVHVRLPFNGSSVEAMILYDFSGYKSFLSCYLPEKGRDLKSFVEMLKKLNFGKTQLVFDGKVTLPSTREFPGTLRVSSVPSKFEVLARFYGDPKWMSLEEIQTSKPSRVFIYAESDLSEHEISELKKEGLALDIEVQFRSSHHAEERAKFESPLAFISHDSRDKEIARKIAINLQKMICPVWYDEFALNVGDNLREKIEKGLRECRKCIIILSPHFFSNNGWTKKEFDSIFTREVLEEQKLVLPIWHEVNKHDVYNYCSSLLMVKGIDWDGTGEEEVCRQLFRSIMQ